MTERDSHMRLTAFRDPKAAEDAEAERRRGERLGVRFPATLVTESLEMDVELTVENVSLGGLFVRADFLEPEGTRLTLAVQLPDERGTIEIRGRVAWVTEVEPRGPGMGIELDETSLAAWDAAVVKSA